MNLAGRMALVSGGAVRIGRAICEALAGAGCGVAVHYDRSGKAADALVKRLNRAGVRAFALQAHFGSDRDCRRLLEAAWKKAGKLDFLVNNAAVFHKHPFSSLSESVLIPELRTNLFVPMALTMAFAKRVGNGRGKVVNLLDQRIAGSVTDCVPYLLSKKMLAEFTKLAAVELAPRITVNAVAPGAVLPAGREDTAREPAGVIPLRRPPTPEDVAAAVVFLLQADSITGQTIFVDGGQNLVS